MAWYSDKDRQNLLEEIGEKLKTLPAGERLHIEKERLEGLIFDEPYNEHKVIVYSGSLLSRIDLSEVSFDRVVWNLHKDIDLSNTNAKINFSKSKSPDGSFSINKSNLANVDLSSNILSGKFKLFMCDLSNSGLKIDFSDRSEFNINHVNLSGNDFSGWTINGKVFEGEGNSYIVDCNLRNTRLNIIADYNLEGSLLENNIKLGYLDGCYLNGQLIGPTSEKDRQSAYEEILQGYADKSFDDTAEGKTF